MRRHHPREQPERHVQPFAAAEVEDPADAPTQFAMGTLEMEKLERVDNDELVETVHDLKNPISTISLEMTLLDDLLTYIASPDVRATMKRITRNLEFLDRLVQDLLDANALDVGSFSLQRRPTELCSLLADVIDRSVSTRDRPRIYLDASGEAMVCVDAVRVERVVANLVHNALKYSPHGTGVVVRLERTPEHVCVTVIDGGPGIAREDIHRIFERYQRGAHGHGNEGSGLGLFISRRIVEAHGGTIGVQSLPNFGSRFFFELPLT